MTGALARVGRDGFLDLAFESRQGRTVLVRRRFKTPLQVLEPLALGEDGSLTVYLLNPTGGLLAGDRLRTEVTLGPKTHVLLTTPSATKVYRSDGTPARQETTFKVGPGATLEYVPDHLIPHPGAHLEQALEVELGAAGRLFLWDAFAVGRIARGEKWLFRRLVSRLEVRCETRPLFCDRYDLSPAHENLVRVGGTAGLGYVGALVLVDPAFGPWDDLVRELDRDLETAGELRGSASSLGRSGLYLRVLAATAYELAARLEHIWGVVRLQVLGLPAMDLRKP